MNLTRVKLDWLAPLPWHAECRMQIGLVTRKRQLNARAVSVELSNRGGALLGGKSWLRRAQAYASGGTQLGVGLRIRQKRIDPAQSNS